MSHHVDSNSEAEEYSEYSDEYSELSSSGTVDTLQDLLQRFTLEYQPDYALKLRHSAGPVVLGADLMQAAGGQRTLAAVMKPCCKERWWRRFKVDSAGLVTLRSRKLRWWVFTLDLEGQANALTRSTNLSFRVATKWDISRGQIRNKRRVAMGPGAEARVHWALSYHLPEIEGSFGTAKRQLEREVHADVGFCHADIPKVELVVWPSRLRAPPRLDASSAGADETAAEEQLLEGAATDGPGGAAISSSASGGEGAGPLATQETCCKQDSGTKQQSGWRQSLSRLRGTSASLSLATLEQFTRQLD